MPVSTLSSDNPTRRHGSINARWDSSLERVQKDDRTTSGAEVIEMDGTGLYERDNWPLMDATERNLSPETVVSTGKDSPSMPEEERDDAMLRKKEGRAQDPAALHFDEEDVSDVEREVNPKNGMDRRDHDSYEDSIREKESPTSSERSSKRSRGSRRSQRSRTSREISVSPIRSDDRPISQPPRPDSHTNISPVRILSSPESFSSDDDQIHQTNGKSSAHDSGTATVAQPQHEHDSDVDSLYEDREEERDVANPMPLGGLDGSYDDPSSSPRTHTTGRSTPTMNGHSRQSSLFKSTPPQRHPSRRSQHIPSNKQRVRYSWQSLHDEEPNRPRIHVIKLVSNTATASAGFPQGEAFGFAISSCGRRIAAYNSARMYILQTAALPVGISQDYALKRRPLSVDLVDDGNVLAILADEHTVNIYDLGHQRLRRINTIKLDFPTTCIALSPTGGLLAVAYEGGVEIFSLDPNALPTDRRAVRSQRMDKLSFSEDGSTLLGTTTRINVSSTVVVSVPVFPAAASGVPTHEELKEAWCAELLHPENIRTSSHSCFLRENRRTCNDRLFAWNGLEDTFGILNVEDLHYGNLDFPIVISPPLSTCGGLGAAVHSCPAIDEHGDTVAMIVNDRTIRLYIVPHRVDDEEVTTEAHSIDHELDEGYGCPFSEVRWVYSSASLPAPQDNQTQVQGRLIVASPGAVVEPGVNEDEDIDDVEAGRIILFDFDPQFTGQAGQTFSLTLGKSPPQLLEEPEFDVAQEVALVRRRTVNQNKGGLSQRPITLGRAATTFGGHGEASRAGTPTANVSAARRSIVSIHSMQSDVTRSLPDLMEGNEALDTFEEPYAQNAPRSHASLLRAASNAQRHRFQAIEERTQERVSVDSTGQFLALPEYTEEPNAPLPSRFRAMAGLDTPAAPPTAKAAIITDTDGGRLSPASSTPSTAPANLAESFSADRAFATATRNMQGSHTQSASKDGAAAATSPTANSSTAFSSISRTDTIGSMAPVARSDTFNSIGPLPRGLQRAYGHATSPIGTGPAPSLIGDWENVSPIIGPIPPRPYPAQSQSATNLRSTETVPEDEPLDTISPAPPSSSHSSSMSPFADRFAATPPAGNTNRYSTSQLNPPGHHGPVRAPSTASSFSPSTASSSTPSSRGRRLPPHMQAFRNAATANTQNASSSLFPQTRPPDHVPHREPTSSPGSYSHPVTAWHPPAPSIASAPSPGIRGHSRKSSLSNRSAFASTAKARKLGFFRGGSKRGRDKDRLFGPEFAGAANSGNGRPTTAKNKGGAESMFETRSIFTTFTNRETRCTLM